MYFPFGAAHAFACIEFEMYCVYARLGVKYILLFAGLEGITNDMSVIDELLSFWKLEDADDTLEKLEDALITRDFGVTTYTTYTHTHKTNAHSRNPSLLTFSLTCSLAHPLPLSPSLIRAQPRINTHTIKHLRMTARVHKRHIPKSMISPEMSI